MENIQVEIISATEAKEIEQNRRVFKIVDCHKKNCYYDGNSDNCSCQVYGSIHTAEIVNENEVIIK